MVLYQNCISDLDNSGSALHMNILCFSLWLLSSIICHQRQLTGILSPLVLIVNSVNFPEEKYGNFLWPYDIAFV